MVKILLYKVRPELKSYKYSVVSFSQHLDKSSLSDFSLAMNSTNDQTQNNILQLVSDKHQEDLQLRCVISLKMKEHIFVFHE